MEKGKMNDFGRDQENRDATMISKSSSCGFKRYMWVKYKHFKMTSQKLCSLVECSTQRYNYITFIYITERS